jgi:hypothetical protein
MGIREYMLGNWGLFLMSVISVWYVLIREPTQTTQQQQQQHTTHYQAWQWWRSLCSNTNDQTLEHDTTQHE